MPSSLSVETTTFCEPLWAGPSTGPDTCVAAGSLEFHSGPQLLVYGGIFMVTALLHKVVGKMGRDLVCDVPDT